MKKLKNSIFFKMGVIFLLIVVLMIPTTLVKELIHEREYVQKNAINEVSSKWGNGQTITGPFISIPYDKYIKQTNTVDQTEKVVKMREWMHFLPKSLDVVGSINPEKRNRGIYEVVVYESDMEIKGYFDPLDWKQFDIPEEDIHFEKATLNFGITDLKGIEQQINLNWNEQQVSFNSGTSTTQIVTSGINASVPILSNDEDRYTFNTKINIKGSQHLYFLPIGEETDVRMTSNWTTPSFTGEYLPDDRTVSENGFEAQWNILHLNRNYPQSWLGNQHRIMNSAFGTDLLLPVDNYKKSYRVARYAILFLALTFMVFFFVEILNKVFIHPIQYLLVGLALIVFYTLLLSFSEHIQFDYAYILSAILTLSMITSYTAAILKSKKVGILIFSILLILYTFIFIIIQLEDYALLIGSIGLFIILGLVMYFSKDIDWYNINREVESTEGS